MRLSLANQVPASYEGSVFRRIMGAIENQLNGLTEGKISVRHFTASSVPTTGTFAVGDIIWNSAPTAGGTIGWVCVAAGSPGTLKAFGSIAS